MVSPGVCALFLLLHHAAPTLLVAPPVLRMKDVFTEDAEEDMMRTIRTGQIPDQLLRDILEEAEKFRDLYEYSPSSFLSREKLRIPLRKRPYKKKKPVGIVSVTRPRFGKRSSESPEVEVEHRGRDTSLERLRPRSPISRAVILYLLRKKYGIPIGNKALRSQTETFSKLTRPRFGKRSFSFHGPTSVVRFLPGSEDEDEDQTENLLYDDQED